jgi:hypothetical protein
VCAAPATGSFYVYRVTHQPSGKVYIGQSIDPFARWRSHLATAKSDRKCLYLHNAIRKHGPATFTWELLEAHSSQEAVDEAEVRLIAQHESTNRDKGYNITAGGSGVHPPTRPAVTWFTYEEAQEWCVERGVKTNAQYTKARIIEPRLPASPEKAYASVWEGSYLFYKTVFTFEECRRYGLEKGLHRYQDWARAWDRGELDPRAPHYPERVYGPRVREWMKIPGRPRKVVGECGLRGWRPRPKRAGGYKVELRVPVPLERVTSGETVILPEPT